MDGTVLTVLEEPDAATVALLDERLYEYNAARTGAEDGRWLAIFVRDEAGELAAGLHGWTWGGVLFVRTLWVRESLRGTGFGTRLMRAAEAEGMRRGCHKAMVDTHSYQAPGFYAKLGYEVIAEIEGYPGESTRVCLKKRLDREGA